MPITNHTLEYCHFEGVLEEGLYGAVPVMAWDAGIYMPEREKARANFITASRLFRTKGAVAEDVIRSLSPLSLE